MEEGRYQLNTVVQERTNKKARKQGKGRKKVKQKARKEKSKEKLDDGAGDVGRRGTHVAASDAAGA